MRSTFINIARSPIKKYKTSEHYFKKLHAHYFKNHPIANGLAQADENLKLLIENGLVILPNYHSVEQINSVRDQIYPYVNAVKTGNKLGIKEQDIVKYEEDGIYRVRGIQNYVNDALPFFNDEYLLDIAHKYTYHPIRSTTGYADYKPDIGVHDGTTTMHMDQWKASIKIFTLLTDIGVSNAPMVYWKKSHKPQPWRFRIDFMNSTGLDQGSGFCPAQLVKNFEKITITGEAGTVIVADTRGIHRASNLLEDHRLQLVQKFTSDFYPHFSSVIKS
ncbi:hypothetical protein [Kiloniella majae]|uniref:hypothetical protein n=1 Tax=Kiloniella majae TaxID=1938558 RepID=UPI000F79044B|nr:hypothetical protein [Kiloniella majae]